MRTAAILSLMLLATAPSATAAAYRMGGLEVADPWSRPAAASTNGAGFMVLANRGPKADTLTAVETPVAARVDIHRSSMSGGVMRMERVGSGLALAPGASVSFAPGGGHLMLVGLKRALRAGDRVPMTLVFASGARLGIEVAVRAAPPAAGVDHMAGHP